MISDHGAVDGLLIPSQVVLALALPASALRLLGLLVLALIGLNVWLGGQSFA